MTNEELLNELRVVADKCDNSREQKAVKSILYSLFGAVSSHQQVRLMNHVAEFSKGEVLRLSANRN